MAIRYDSSPLQKAERLDNGYLRAPAALTRAGVFVYRLADGSERRELRHPDEVFKKDSLDTLRQMPVTDRHPPEMLTAKNTKKFSVGSVGERLDREGDSLTSTVLITDASAISAIDMGIRREVSCGYHCDMVSEAGEWQGEAYDSRQTNIRYNHAALVEVGRAGPEVRLRLDSDEAVLVTAPNSKEYVTIEEVNPQPQKDPRMDKKIEELEASVKGLQEKLDAKDVEVKDMAKSNDEAQAKLDSALEKLGKSESEEAKRNDADEFRKAVRSRVDLEAKAAPILGEEVKLDTLDDLAIKLAVVEKLAPKADLEGKSPEYISARFDAAVEDLVAGQVGLEKVRQDLRPSTEKKDEKPFAKMDSQFIPSGGKQ